MENGDMKTTLLALVFASSLSLQAADWPQWRGPERASHAAVSVNALPKELKQVWKQAVGPGFSAPVVAGGKLIYLDARDGQEIAHCLDAASGKKLWATP